MTVAPLSMSSLPWPMRTGAVCPGGANGLVTVSFSTDDIPEPDRVTMWRNHYARIALRVEIEPAKARPFEACLVSHILPGLHLLSGTLSAARITRTRASISDGNDEFALVINRTGCVSVSARGRGVTLAANDAVLIRSDEEMVYDRSSHGESISLRVPRLVLSSLVVDIDDAVMWQIPAQSKILKLLTRYATTLIDENTLAKPCLRNTAVSHVHDLVALLLGSTRDIGEIAKGGGLGGTRLRTAKTYIAENSSRQDLSINVVAAHQGVTPRYLQRLFEAEGTTFSAFLLNQRLTCAFRILRDAQSSGPVSGIAYDVGFSDLSYFNRCFRKLYGMTPTEVRQASAR